jgi:hypothetical protein
MESVDRGRRERLEALLLSLPSADS